MSVVQRLFRPSQGPSTSAYCTPLGLAVGGPHACRPRRLVTPPGPALPSCPPAAPTGAAPATATCSRPIQGQCGSRGHQAQVQLRHPPTHGLPCEGVKLACKQERWRQSRCRLDSRQPRWRFCWRLRPVSRTGQSVAHGCCWPASSSPPFLCPCAQRAGAHEPKRVGRLWQRKMRRLQAAVDAIAQWPGSGSGASVQACVHACARHAPPLLPPHAHVPARR